MPWLETDVRDQRVQFIVAATTPDARMTDVCRVFGISRRTGYKWLARYEAAGGVAALRDRSRRPHQSPGHTPPAITARVCALRDLYGWGGEKLRVVLAAEGVTLAARTIDRIIAREGRTHRDAAPAAALGRFTRGAPNDLWQMDAKGHYPVGKRGRCHPLSILDDHSRFAVGLYPLTTLQTAPVQAALIDCFEHYGVPTAMLMDHGVPWCDPARPTGLTRLGVFLVQQGIRVIHGRVRHPQTQGKVERFHRTLAERLRWWGVPTALPAWTDTLAAFRTEYNDIRPHAALGQEPPALHFQRSPRAYRPTPPPWQYAAGCAVQRVDAAASITYAGRRFFISEALIGQEVATTRLEQAVLVQYRHMYVRELHLTTGQSASLLTMADK
jgi:transposase InsO family protein